MNNDNEKKILDLVSKLDFSKAVYNEYDIETCQSGVKKHSHTAVFDFEKPISSKILTIELKVYDRDNLAYIRKVNNMNVDIILDYDKYLDMVLASQRGMVDKTIKIIEDYLNS